MSTDSALLYTPSKIPGKPLAFDTDSLQLGDELAVLGYPLGVTDLSISTGVVSHLHQRVSVGGEDGEYVVDDAFITDAATNPGNSGGPAVDTAGRVIGLVSARYSANTGIQGTNFMIPATSLSHNLATWRNEAVRDQGTCQGEAPPTQDQSGLTVTNSSTHQYSRDISRSLYLHGYAINTGNYEAAWSLFTPHEQKELGSLAEWKKGLSTSVWESVAIKQVTGSGTTLSVHVTLRTCQAAKYGPSHQTRSVFAMIYRMKEVDGVWLIHNAKSSDAPKSCS